MNLNIGNEENDEYLVIVLSSLGQLLVTLGNTLNNLGQSLGQEDVNEEQIMEHKEKQLEIHFNLQLIEQKLIELMEQHVIFLQKQIEKMSN